VSALSSILGEFEEIPLARLPLLWPVDFVVGQVDLRVPLGLQFAHQLIQSEDLNRHVGALELYRSSILSAKHQHPRFPAGGVGLNPSH
jgi:hypothetical protein